jgi:hypothetical protein
MCARTLLLTAFAVLLGGALLTPDAQAAKRPQVHNLSVNGAMSICGGEGGFMPGPGGGSSGGCSFCHTTNKTHCHVVNCTKGGKCTNIVYSSRPPPDGSKGTKGVGNPATGVKGIGTGGDRGKFVSGTSRFKPAGPGGSVRLK